VAPYVVRRQVPKHAGLLSEEFLVSVVLHAAEEDVVWFDDEHFVVEVKRRKDGGFVRVSILVHDQGWRLYVYGVHVEACR